MYGCVLACNKSCCAAGMADWPDVPTWYVRRVSRAMMKCSGCERTKPATLSLPGFVPLMKNTDDRAVMVSVSSG